MRARSAFPLLFSFCLVLLLAALSLFGAGGAPGAVRADSLAWSELAGLSGGPAQALAVNPSYPADQTVLAGGGRDVGYASWNGSGLFRSLDGGLTWGGRSGPPDGALLDAAFSPNWANDGFALAGFWQGVWSTSDRGQSWRMLSSIDGAPPGFVRAVAVASPAAGVHTLLAGGPYGGVHRSVDEGATWSWNGDPGGVARLVFHPLLPDIALAATNTGLWRSTTGGLQWTRVTTATAVYDVAFAGDGSAVAAYDGHGWRSEDDGATWQQLGGAAIERFGVLGFSDDGAGLFAAVDGQLYRYDLAAGEFITLTTAPALGYILRLAPSPAFATDHTLLLSTYDGVWRSSDSGQTFVRSAGFTPLRVTAIGAEGALAGDLYAGTENGLWRRSAGSWEPLNQGVMLGSAPPIRSVTLSPAYAQDQTLFIAAGSNSGLGASLLRSTDRGAAWQRLIGAEYIDQAAISPAFATDRRLYLVGVQRIQSSSNGGDAWTVQPFWDFTHTARALAISPGFAQDQTLVAVGNGVYRSSDGGATWSVPAGAPPVSALSGTGWQTGKLLWSRSGRLYLTLYAFDGAAPFTRHDQLWASADKGQNWSQISAAPDLPVAGLAAGPSPLGSGSETICLSVFDENEVDERIVAADLYISRNSGAGWLNLGAIPGGAAVLAAPVDAADRLWAGSRGLWLLEAGQAPTVTPPPVRELLANRSFEYQGVWRIPDTAYRAAYSQEQHFAGYWSMRSGIAAPAANVRSYSDFSQDVTLPVSTTITLRLHRWPSSGMAQAVAAAAPVTLAAGTLDAFYSEVEAAGGDLQYILLIEQPGQSNSRINYLYTGLDNQQAWQEESYDLTKYGGKSVRLQFGVFNNGSGALALQYFDVLSVDAAPSLTQRMWLPEVFRDMRSAGTIPPAP